MLLMIPMGGIMYIVNARRQRRIYSLVHQLQADTRITGVPVEFVNYSMNLFPEAQQQEMHATLAILLMRASAEDLHSFTKSKQQTLNNILYLLAHKQNQPLTLKPLSAQEKQLLLAILHVLPLLDESISSKRVRYWANQKEHAEVQAAAQTCLAQMQERLALRNKNAQLLRASSADVSAENLLLRATIANSDCAPPEQLLRAGSARNGEGE